MPPRRERFAFDGMAANPAGTRITERCTACGICLEACPVQAISEGTIYRIDSMHSDDLFLLGNDPVNHSKLSRIFLTVGRRPAKHSALAKITATTATGRVETERKMEKTTRSRL